MGRKKKIEGEPTTAEPQGIEEIIGKYLDPDNPAMSMKYGNRLVVNSTQVSKANIEGLLAELPGLGVILTIVDFHPSQYTEETSE